MNADLVFLRDKILAQHPHPFLYGNEDRWLALQRSIARHLDAPLDRIEFYRRIAPLAAFLRDGHTLVNPPLEDFHAYADAHGVFPLQVRFVDRHLIVAANASTDARLDAGTEIVSIDGRAVKRVVADYRELINDVGPLYDVYARLFRELYWLRYGSADTFEIGYASPRAGSGTVTVAAHRYQRSEFQSYRPEGDAHAFEMLAPDVGLLTVNSFSPSDDYDAFLERSFAALRAEHARGLIIDVRRNGGGSGRLAQSLMSYLTDVKYPQIGAFYVKVTDDLKALYAQGTTHTDEDTRRLVEANRSGTLVDGLRDSGPVFATPAPHADVFRGDVAVLTANNTFSAAAMFAAYFKCSGRGKVVGEEPGQATQFVADAVPFTMPHSELTFGVSFSEIHMPCERSYFHGIRPDVRVSGGRAPATAAGAAGDPVVAAALEVLAKH
ncbi:MAG TPA: S41 family peptidase [Dokdonella sp.]